MNHFRQVWNVTMWEYRRFFKPKNEILGIVIMLIIFTIGFSAGKYAISDDTEKKPLSVMAGLDPRLESLLTGPFTVTVIQEAGKSTFLASIASSHKGMLLEQSGDQFLLFSWQKPGNLTKLTTILDQYRQEKLLEKLNLTRSQFEDAGRSAELEIIPLKPAENRGGKVLAFFFAGLMVLAVFLSFAYQFTAITGEKQLRITELIISAIKPQVWMDGKIYGITLTALSSMLIYSVMGLVGGMLFFQFTGVPPSSVLHYLHPGSILVFLAFTLMGIVMWNAFNAAIASVITDPNNSGKNSIMLLPLVFVVASLLVLRNPDNQVSAFLSWFPLTASTAMPLRWIVADVSWWQLAGSYFVLTATFYILRKFAARIFHSSILNSGKEPTWKEVFRFIRNGQ